MFNGTTSEERVNYYLTVPADSVEGGMRFLAAALIKPLFRKDELEREREVVIGEYDRNESNPFFQFSTAMGKALWTTAWSRKNPLGEREVIQSTTPEKMRTIQQRYYVPNNTALIVTGDVAPAKAFCAREDDLRRLEARRRSVRDRSDSADSAAHDATPRSSSSSRSDASSSMLQWQGPSATTGSRGDLRGRRLLRRAQPARLALSAAARRQRLFQSIGVNYYTLNHVGPITIRARRRRKS